MAMLLRLVGAIWAGLGAANVVGMFMGEQPLSSGISTFGLIFNMVLFIIPGLVLVGLASRMDKKGTEQADRAKPAAERLAELDELLSAGAIDAAEHATRRQKIIDQV